MCAAHPSLTRSRAGNRCSDAVPLEKRRVIRWLVTVVLPAPTDSSKIFPHKSVGSPARHHQREQTCLFRRVDAAFLPDWISSFFHSGRMDHILNAIRDHRSLIGLPEDLSASEIGDEDVIGPSGQDPGSDAGDRGSVHRCEFPQPMFCSICSLGPSPHFQRVGTMEPWKASRSVCADILCTCNVPSLRSVLCR
ncbi:hypothetical protein VTK56DRAFT_4413 [Thermocarpiscus australiensis]